MAEIVLVHGIDQQQKSADKLESAWLPALAGGIRDGGFPEVADRIWRNAGKPGSIDTRMAFYGNLFLAPGQQGDDPGDFSPEEAQFAEALAVEWLKHVAERATKQKIRETGERELSYVTKQMGAEQGVGSIMRSAIGRDHAPSIAPQRNRPGRHSTHRSALPIHPPGQPLSCAPTIYSPSGAKHIDVDGTVFRKGRCGIEQHCPH